MWWFSAAVAVMVVGAEGWLDGRLPAPPVTLDKCYYTENSTAYIHCDAAHSDICRNEERFYMCDDQERKTCKEGGYFRPCYYTTKPLCRAGKYVWVCSASEAASWCPTIYGYSLKCPVGVVSSLPTWHRTAPAPINCGEGRMCHPEGHLCYDGKGFHHCNIPYRRTCFNGKHYTPCFHLPQAPLCREGWFVWYCLPRDLPSRCTDTPRQSFCSLNLGEVPKAWQDTPTFWSEETYRHSIPLTPSVHNPTTLGWNTSAQLDGNNQTWNNGSWTPSWNNQ
eukprot:Sspe_Gene.110590::Locus_91647_Transcript_1_1_Confidence_1.000_Length_921::g.110590::m.110590